jgi:hypothetical protein
MESRGKLELHLMLLKFSQCLDSESDRHGVANSVARSQLKKHSAN